jgi:ABC-type dipeptide/oligopeptide/nickel transport system permease component
MARYLTQRILLAVATVWAICTLTFFLAYLAPGDPAQIAAGQHSDAQAIARARHELGLDKPPLVRYGLYMVGILHGDLGKSYVTREPVTSFLARCIGPTAILAVTAIVLALIVGVSLGVTAATFHNSFVDKALMGLAVTGVSVPNFVLGPVLVLLFSVKLGWLPTAGWGDPSYLVLPAIVLAARPGALIARMTRASTIETLRQDYIRTAKSKGLSPTRILFRHVLKNALLPVLTTAGVSFGFLLSGSFVVETVFTIPGVGYQSVASLSTRDYTLIQGTTLMLAVIFVTVNLIVDMLYMVLDPRIRPAQSMERS